MRLIPSLAILILSVFYSAELLASPLLIGVWKNIDPNFGPFGAITSNYLELEQDQIRSIISIGRHSSLSNWSAYQVLDSKLLVQQQDGSVREFPFEVGENGARLRICSQDYCAHFTRLINSPKFEAGPHPIPNVQLYSNQFFNDTDHFNLIETGIFESLFKTDLNNTNPKTFISTLYLDSLVHVYAISQFYLVGEDALDFRSYFVGGQIFAASPGGHKPTLLSEVNASPLSSTTPFSVTANHNGKLLRFEWHVKE